ncbi:hypothetical protein [Acanthamoeba polyphaga mimivirus]|nr:hypothetical protein [Acanthamoeba polyphaga mimivirus]
MVKDLDVKKYQFYKFLNTHDNYHEVKRSKVILAKMRLASFERPHNGFLQIKMKKINHIIRLLEWINYGQRIKM